MKADNFCNVYRSDLGCELQGLDLHPPSVQSTFGTASCDEKESVQLAKESGDNPSSEWRDIPKALLTQKTRLLLSGVVKPLFCRADLAGRCSYCFANVRDHRHLPVARSVQVERSGTSTERDAGRCSVDRIVRILLYYPPYLVLPQCLFRAVHGRGLHHMAYLPEASDTVKGFCIRRRSFSRLSNLLEYFPRF